MKDQQRKYIGYAVLAALLYALSTPFSKILLGHVSSYMMASLLYYGAGVGVGLLWLFHKDRKTLNRTNLQREDLKYTIGMIVLDIAAPLFLMAGLNMASAANVSLLNNFEIVCTAVIALVIFQEKISKRMWEAIGLITLASMLLSFEDASSLQFSMGSLFVIFACMCWGLENNCTRAISERNIYEIVTLKGIGSGTGSLMTALAVGSAFPEPKYACMTLLLGFAAYGLSIFVYIAAQKGIGAARTSAYYGIAPFISAGLSLILLKEKPTWILIIALIVMALGTLLVTIDTMYVHHTHMHTHVITEVADGKTAVRTITHSHPHDHRIGDLENHHHRHRVGMHWV